MKDIIDLLNTSNFYGGDGFIQIAKGQYERPATYKGWFKKIIRKISNKIVLWQLKNN